MSPADRRALLQEVPLVLLGVGSSDLRCLVETEAVQVVDEAVDMQQVMSLIRARRFGKLEQSRYSSRRRFKVISVCRTV